MKTQLHIFCLCVGLLAVTPITFATDLPSSPDLSTIRAIAVQHDGRWPPLDTVARDVVESVTGTVFYQDHDPVKMLLAWTFDSKQWKGQPPAHLQLPVQPPNRANWLFQDLPTP